MDAKPIVTDLLKCARCGEDHKALEFKLFTNPPTDALMKSGDDILSISRWSMCPKLNEPILLSIDLQSEG